MLLVLAAVAAPAPAAPPSVGARRRVRVIVRELPGAGTGLRTVRLLGGEPGRRPGIIDGFVAEVSAEGLRHSTAAPGVLSVTPDRE